MSDDAQTLAAIGSSRAPIKVTCGEYEGRRTLDIRRYFFDRATKQLKPTTKGISVVRETYKELRAVLEQNQQTIDAWFEGGGRGNSSDVARRDEQANREARQEARLAPLPVDMSRDPSKGVHFFRCASAGGRNVLTLNTSHPFLAALNEVQNGTRNAEELFGHVLSAFARAKSIFADADAPVQPAELFELIEFNWGLYLGQLLSTPTRHDGTK